MPSTTAGLIKNVINALQNKIVLRAAAGVGIVVIAAAGLLRKPAYQAQNNVGAVVWEVRTDGTVNESGTLLVKSGSLAIMLRGNGDAFFQGTMSGNHLYAGTMSGAGLTDCDTAGTSKLLWDVSTGRFSCGTDTDTNTTYTAGQSLSLISTSFKLGANITGTTLKFQTLSGNALTISGNASFTGNVLVKGTVSTRSTISGAALTIMNGTNYILGNVGIGATTTPRTKLEIFGSFSGSQLYVSSGVTIARGQKLPLLLFKDLTNAKTSYLFTGSGSPVGVVNASTGSLYTDNYKGGFYGKSTGPGNQGWQQLTASGSKAAGRIYISTSQTIKTNVFQKLYFDTKSSDPQNIFDVSSGHASTNSGTLKAPVTGLYYVHCATGIATLNSGQYFYIEIQVNGATQTIKLEQSTGAGYTVYGETNDVLPLVKNDIVACFVQQNGATTNTTTSAFFSAAQIYP